ncbi:MAG: ribosome biogenesis GTPase Der [Thermodesulfobacteriota bacterium]
MNNKKYSDKPLVAIVGRPNVGKSTLFNCIIEQRKAIVEDIPGVTRDRIYGDAEWKNHRFAIVDTGGLVINPADNNEQLIKEQVQIAIDDADLILFMLDGKDGLLPGDEEIFKHLRESKVNVLFIVNKIDHDNHDIRAYEFHKLGLDKYIAISALHNRNTYELIDEIVNKLPDCYDAESEDKEDVLKISVIGKPNVGKSTLVNSIIGENRFITSPVPGTTRDSVDTSFVLNGKDYLIVDTAGIRRKSKVSELLERYSVLRAVRSISRSDIVLFLIDATQGPTHHDSRLGELIESRGVASIVILNKWDLAPAEVNEVTDLNSITKENLKSLGYSPVLRLSALTGKGIPKLFNVIDKIYENYTRKIKTNELNNFLDELKKKNPPSIYKGHQLKFYYITQLYSKPPTFILFTNARKGIPENYKRYIENQLRANFDFEGTPIRLIFRTRDDDNIKK